MLALVPEHGGVMPRPRKIRLVEGPTPVHYYKPRGIPLGDLVETVLSLDGLEALRHADVEGRDQAEAARIMGVSRSTFSRLLAEARTVVATALTRGWAIRIEGGPVATVASCGAVASRACRAIATVDGAGPRPVSLPQPSGEPSTASSPGPAVDAMEKSTCRP